MDHRVAVQGIPQFVFDCVDHIMQREDVAVGGNLRVQGDKNAAGTVVMYDEVMNPDDLLMRGDNIRHLLDKFRIRSLTEQGTDGIFGSAEAGIADEETDEDTAPAVDA